ncbi:serine protease 7-like protein, partial [Dinothrombium tinctorium]
MRVIDGDDARVGEVPWQVAIKVFLCNAIQCQTMSCGGSIWDETTIITAAHCIPQRAGLQTILNVCIGSVRLDDPNRVCYRAIDAIIHPGWNPRYFVNDIAIIKVSRMNIPMVSRTGGLLANNVCEPKRSNYMGSFVVSGFGRNSRYSHNQSNRLQIAQLVPAGDACRQVNPYFDEKTQLCLKGIQGETACQGDSGGPVTYINEEGHHELVGVVSYGRQDCPRHGGVAYTNVHAYLSFIKQYAGNL